MGYSNRADWKDKTIALSCPDEYDPKTNTFDYIEYGWFIRDWEFISIEPFYENGVGKVMIELNDYNMGDEHTVENLFRHETFIYFWDDEVGFVVESSSWRWPDTNQVRIVGNVKEFETLWGTYADGSMSVITTEDGLQLFVDGDALKDQNRHVTYNHKVYHIYGRGSELLFNSFDFSSLEQSTGDHIYSFKNERIKHIVKYYNESSLFVYTDIAAYRFNYDFRLEERRPWSMDMDGERLEYAVVSDDFSRYAIVGDSGVYLCNMKDDATPKLIQESIPFNFDKGGNFESPFPIRFIDNDRLLIGVHTWESIGALRVLDLHGNTLDNIPFNLGGIAYGGTCVLDRNKAFTDAMSSGEEYGYYYYDFAKSKLESAQWLEPVYFSGNRFVPDPNNPNIWYVTKPHGKIDWYITGNDSNSFLKIDFESKSVTELPITAWGCDVNLLAVGENGEPLFSYKYKNEKGFCVYNP